MELCKKCKKPLPEGALYCPFCGSPQKKNPKKKLYQRPDGLYEKIITIDGKRKAFRGKTEAQVYREIASYQEEKERGERFRTIADDWWESFCAKYKGADGNGTQRSYLPCYNRALEWFGEDYIADLSSQDIQVKIDAFAGSHAFTTVTNQICVINHILTHAILTDRFPSDRRNPCEYIRAPKRLKKGRRNPPTEEQIKKVAVLISQPEKVKEFPGAALALLFLSTGIRFGEALALQYKDIDFEKLTISVRKSVTFEGNRPIIKAPKTEAGIRTVAIPPFLPSLLPSGEKGNYIFSGTQHPLTYSQYTSLWLAFCKQIGEVERKTFASGKRKNRTYLAPTITAHQFRHEYASLLYKMDVGIKEAQSLLGHAQASTTQDTYTHLKGAQMQKTLHDVSRKIQNELVHSDT